MLLERRDLGQMMVNKVREGTGAILWGLLGNIKVLGLLSNCEKILLTCFLVTYTHYTNPNSSYGSKKE